MHPLSMMTEDEARTAQKILRDAGHVDDASRFHGFCIHEPPKSEVAAWTPGDEVDRRLEVVVRNGGEVYEATVSVSRGEVDRWEHQPDVVPRIGFLEIATVQQACRDSEAFQAAVAARGVDDVSKVQIDPWPTGDYGFEFEAGRRVQRCIGFFRPEPADNGYAYPLDGILVHIDVDTLEVLQGPDGHG